MVRIECRVQDIATRLEEGGGLCIIDNFLPPAVAEVALQLLKEVCPTDQEDDKGY